MRYLLACLVALAAAGAWAADVAQMRPGVESTPQPYDESEDLYFGGAGADLVATRDTDKFERNIARVLAMVRYESIYDFIALGAGSDEFRQGNQSLRVNSLLAVMRKVNRATAEGFSVRGAVAFNGDQKEFLGEGIWNIRLAESTGIELIANRDAVETFRALQEGIMANFFAVSVDHAVTERLTVIGMPTYRRFSDGNEQTGVRAWVIYGLLPEHGLSLQLRVRGFESTQSGNGAYFSPDRYERAEIGLRLRRAVGDWRVFATAEIGQERIDRDVENPTWQFALTAQRNIAGNASLGLQFAYYRASDSTNNTTVSDSYAWRMARVYFTIPF